MLLFYGYHVFMEMSLHIYYQMCMQKTQKKKKQQQNIPILAKWKMKIGLRNV